MKSHWHFRTILCTLVSLLASSHVFAATLVLDPLFSTGTVEQPVHVAAPPGDNDRLFILDRQGQVYIYNRTPGTLETAPYLDLTGYASLHNLGAFSISFDPDFASNSKIYVSFADAANNLRVVSFAESAADSSIVDGTTFTNVITVTPPTDSVGDHFAGWIGFSPDDGMLYVTTGDGNANPINNVSQDNSQSGAILRIDPNFDPATDIFLADSDNNYGIPSDNPHLGDAIDDAVFAKGLRNPFRASFDANTGTLLVSDVGENSREEINLGVAGANYGWPGFEGSLEFDLLLAGIDSSVVTFPIYEYGDPAQNNSITGGETYRGPIAELDGLYFFADYISGEVWSFLYDAASGNILDLRAWDLEYLGSSLLDHPVSFGVDSNGNLYILDLDFYGGLSDIFLVSDVRGFAAVPLPASLPLLGTALAGFFVFTSFRRRQRNRSCSASPPPSLS